MVKKIKIGKVNGVKISLYNAGAYNMNNWQRQHTIKTISVCTLRENKSILQALSFCVFRYILYRYQNTEISTPKNTLETSTSKCMTRT